MWLADAPDSDVFFSDRTMKLASVLAGLATAKFGQVCPKGYEDRLPHFDARVFQLPSRTEAANVFLWRAMDCRRNAISMVAQSVFSHRELHGKTQADMLAMLAEAGVDYDGHSEKNRLGVFLRRRSVERHLTPEELARIPEASRPAGPVVRSVVDAVAMPPFNEVANREAVIFDGDEPVLRPELALLEEIIGSSPR